MSFLVPPRSYEPEILDRPGHGMDVLAPVVRDLSRVNRWLGGTASVLRPLKERIRRDRLEAFTLLDIGTGGGDTPRAVLSWGSRAGLSIRAAGIDLDPAMVRLARGRPGSKRDALEIVRGDAFLLPFPDAAFDYVVCSMVLHHFREDDAVRFLSEMARIARRGVIAADLARNLVPWAGIGILGLLFSRCPMFRSDAPLSVLRGWTTNELERLAARAGLSARARIERPVPYRLALVVEGSHAA